MQPRAGATEESEWKREGWDRRGARSRLDRRRSLKESVKRRALDADSPAFTDEDLRYRQLTRRRQPALRAAVFFLLDVSGSMSDRDRQLAKTFFFWVAAGLRREYKALDIVFVAHTTDAWEFSEADFFKVDRQRRHRRLGRVSAKVREIMDERFDPSTCNVYLFYASDGDNASDDRSAGGRRARGDREGGALLRATSEITAGVRSTQSETTLLFQAAADGRTAVQPILDRRVPTMSRGAVRHFFTVESQCARCRRGRRRPVTSDWRSSRTEDRGSRAQARTRLVAR